MHRDCRSLREEWSWKVNEKIISLVQQNSWKLLHLMRWLYVLNILSIVTAKIVPKEWFVDDILKRWCIWKAWWEFRNRNEAWKNVEVQFIVRNSQTVVKYITDLYHWANFKTRKSAQIEECDRRAGKEENDMSEYISLQVATQKPKENERQRRRKDRYGKTKRGKKTKRYGKL